MRNTIIPVNEQVYDLLNVDLLAAQQRVAELLAAAEHLVAALDAINFADASGEIAALSFDEIKQMNAERDAAHEHLRDVIAHARESKQ
jgi:Ni,Fe-hydrogenase maturation factor